MINDHGYDGNHINGIIDLTDKGIGVTQSFIYLAFWARCIDYNIDEQKIPVVGSPLYLNCLVGSK